MTGLLEQTCQLDGRIAVFDHQTSGAVDQATGDAHRFHTRAQSRLHAFEQRLEIGSRFFGLLFLGFVLQFTQIDRSFGHTAHGSAIELVHE